MIAFGNVRVLDPETPAPPMIKYPYRQEDSPVECSRENDIPWTAVPGLEKAGSWGLFCTRTAHDDELHACLWRPPGEPAYLIVWGGE